MLPFLLGLGAIAVIAKVIYNNSEEEVEDKKVFISFSMKDVKYRDYLVEQSENDRSPFSFVDMSVREAWDDDKWKAECKKRIETCDGLLVLISDNLEQSKGAIWEIKCAKEEAIPVYGMHIFKHKKCKIPKELKGHKIIKWSWDNLKDIVNSI
ncbi:hypothetical protein IMCC3317_02400 [Kordia antarctica]|uniref:Thoeris protein ThsB TIR-like domain-containing protein n=1 Tax=Kordia antarctica TaxID=1218801 RepID=A0A7L4ZE02_9FLAO|nr:TIR domain-containing protein [Kordia antarctica]QHI34895.1 hypothetical protein IMCC3317_02400 [Kordia antarctica]